MAMSKPLGEKIDQLTCTLCLELYKSPKVLPCLHTFCEQCLEKFISSIGANKEGSVSPFGCPICRTKVNPIKKYTEVKEWVSDFPSNNIITLMLVQNEGLKIECDPCKRADETSNAKVWCPTCMESLCEMCEKVHNRMRISKDHQAKALSEIGILNQGFDFSAILEFCPHHPRKELDHFCSDHDQICCSACILSNHKHCETILIEDTTEEPTKFDLSFLPGELATIKDEASKLLEERKQQKAKLKSYTEKVKEDVFTFTENIKSRLDNLQEVFNKEVNILQEEENTELNVAIRLIEQLLSALGHWTNVLEKVPENASETKRFQIRKTIKKQLSECLAELSSQMNRPDIDVLKLDTSDMEGVVRGLEILDRIGNLAVVKSCAPNKLTQVRAICETTKIFCIPTFETLSMKFIRNIKVQGMNIISGTCLGTSYIIIGVNTGTKLMVLSKDNGFEYSEIEIGRYIKRICLNKQNNQAFLSCDDKTLVTVDIEETQLKSTSRVKTERKLGGIKCRGEQVYLVNEGSILTFNSSNNPERSFEQCFTTNTDHSSTGLGVQNETVYYSTKNNEIKCTSIDGTDIFCFKPSTEAKPCNLAILSSGLVLFADTSENGKLHLLSADGKKSRILLEKFENVTVPSDLWLDSDATSFYVCGGNNIDVYQIQ